MKRLGIFVFYDKSGKVDRYVSYLLQRLMDYLDRLVIVCNGSISPEGREILEAFADDIHVRDNTGFDAMAYKLAMTDYLGWQEILEYDEVLTFNDTFFGPLYPFEEMFSAMDVKDCDFWGLTYHAEATDYFYGTKDVLPPHVHTYFSAYRRPVLESAAFQTYWNEFDSTEWYFSDVCRHEQFFTKYLEDAGFSWDAYIKPEIYLSERPENNNNPYFHCVYELISTYRCPIIKRKNFAVKYTSMQAGHTGQGARDAFDFIREHTEYDVDMIWENVLRLYNVAQIKNALHLDYVLPGKRGGAAGASGKYEDAAILIHIGNGPTAELCKPYIESIPAGIEVCIVQDECELDMADMVLKHKDLFREKKYLCFVHAADTTDCAGPVAIRSTLQYMWWENILKSPGYIDEVLRIFEENTRLGFLAPPLPVHADFFGKIGDEWGECYDDTVRLAEKMGINAQFTRDIQCFAVGNVFWCRTEAMLSLVDFLEENELNGLELPALERIYPYIAQSCGFYSGAVMNTDYASLQCTNLYYYLSGMVDKIRGKNPITDYDTAFEHEMIDFCKGADNVLLYGAGTCGIKASSVLRGHGIIPRGFVVSDDQPRQKDKVGLPIYRLSEVPYNLKESKIIICLQYARARKAVLENLKKMGIKDYYQFFE